MIDPKRRPENLTPEEPEPEATARFSILRIPQMSFFGRPKALFQLNRTAKPKIGSSFGSWVFEVCTRFSQKVFCSFTSLGYSKFFARQHCVRPGQSIRYTGLVCYGF